MTEGGRAGGRERGEKGVTMPRGVSLLIRLINLSNTQYAEYGDVWCKQGKGKGKKEVEAVPVEDDEEASNFLTPSSVPLSLHPSCHCHPCRRSLLAAEVHTSM